MVGGNREANMSSNMRRVGFGLLVTRGSGTCWFDLLLPTWLYFDVGGQIEVPSVDANWLGLLPFGTSGG